MPSGLPRVTAYVKPETLAALDAACKAVGRSRSSLVGELLDSSLPMMQAITDAALALHAAGQLQREAMAAAADELAAVTARADDLQGTVIDLLGRVAKPPASDPHPLTGGSES